MLTASKLQVKRGFKTVVSDLNLDIQPREGLGLVGPNGAGKTSLLLAILGVIPSNGVIERTFTSFELGVVWQDRCLPLNVSVKNWLSYLAGIFNQPLDLELLERFNIRNDSKLIRTMSGGEAQKLAIVSAFFHKPKMLVLDEPTVGLDMDSRREFLDLCKERIAAGASILITSHIPSDISAISTRITNLTNTNHETGLLFSTSRALTKEELEDLARILEISHIHETSSGYFIQTDKDVFALIGNYSVGQNFSITSFSSL